MPVATSRLPIRSTKSIDFGVMHDLHLSFDLGGGFATEFDILLLSRTDSNQA